MKNLDAFLILLAVRLASVFIVQTSFVPDEYWQSLEVAHNIVFKYGYLTWEWSKGIRSYIPPLVVAAFYKILQIIGLDTVTNLIYGPRILQAFLSSYSDLCFYKWSGCTKWGVFYIATSWFWFYTGSRTLINTLECALTTIALSKYPWPGSAADDKSTFIWIVALIFVIRPTSALVWVPLVIYHLAVNKESPLDTIVNRYVPIGASVLFLSILLDSLVHGYFVVTVYEFLKFNILEDVASFYGVQPWYWYLSAGLPAVLGIGMVPFVLVTIVVVKNRQIHQNELVILGTVVFSVLVYSCLPHKEFRFLLPILPLILHVSSRYLSAWSRKANSLHIWIAAIVILIGNAVPAWYFSVVHQRGTLDVMYPLREIALENPKNTSLLFLMPCHSTPLYSYLHVNVTTRFLTCTPNLSKVSGYVDEADMFYRNPSRWWQQNYSPTGGWPSHIISFDSLVPSISDILSRYKLTHQIYHTSIPESTRVGRYVLVHERIDIL
ncbi:hypothetical protein NQ317_015163 [Molorchus minor]|uniref:Mannosyltransferase n=1 Tax=Molorchus minor TaxID=1323400 RepID=A0ABQ9K4Y5_9CUCU|nr:hypothetical protein NQ317_015163 [Molorchus minor]